jgi:hypothetical protein
VTRFVLLLSATILGCATACARTDAPPPSAPQEWASLVGKRVTVEGTAANAKMGALLETDRGHVWIDGLDSWPSDYYPGPGKGRRLRVTGIVVEHDDLPVFVPKPGEPIMQGIPIEPDADIGRARRRYLLQNATW